MAPWAQATKFMWQNSSQKRVTEPSETNEAVPWRARFWISSVWHDAALVWLVERLSIGECFWKLGAIFSAQQLGAVDLQYGEQ